MKKRCWDTSDPIMQTYHDIEWGTPLHDDQKLFEFLILDGFQAGLSWHTILHKRENFRNAFDDFDFKKIALYSDGKLDSLLENKGIIRNKLKIYATRSNAQALLRVQEEFGSFDKFLWKFVNFSPIDNKLTSFGAMPAKTPLSAEISKELKKKGFKFVGPTIIYAFMQAIGMVNDHLTWCFRYSEIRS